MDTRPLPADVDTYVKRSVYDMTGQRVNMFTVLGFSHFSSDRWVVQCDCGTIKEMAGNTLRGGNRIQAQNCGCVEVAPKDLSEQDIALRTSSLRANKAKVTREQVEALYNVETRVCEICGLVEQGSRWHIDHDHRNGKLRGLLCPEHNVGLGKMQDSIWVLLKAILYIIKYRVIHFWRK